MSRTVSRPAIAGKLQDLIRGEVLSEASQLRKYAFDQSIYEITPLAVVLPDCMEDLQKVVRFASEEGIPLTPRGGGSGTAGSSLGEGIVIGFRRGGFLGSITGFSQEGKDLLVITGAAVYHNVVQKFLRERGCFLPADPTSSAISRIGGNIATKASGPHALRYGSIDRFLEQIEFITNRGERVNTANETTLPSRIKKGLEQLALRFQKDEEAMARLAVRKGMKTSSGYNLFALQENLTAGQRVSQLFAGSVGTLGLITSATLRGVPFEPLRAVLKLSFDNLQAGSMAVRALRENGATAIEILSRKTVQILRKYAPSGNKIHDDGHLLLVEFEGETGMAGLEKVRELLKGKAFHLSGEPLVATDRDEMTALWEIRKQVFPVLLKLDPTRKALSVVNDVGVDPDDLPAVIAKLQHFFEQQGMETLIYGHAGNGNLHLRPLFDTTDPHLKERIKAIADGVYEIVFQYGGTVTAEHGMGRVRAPYLKREWGETLYGYMKEIKAIFDPGGLFNPGVMFNEDPITEHVAIHRSGR